MTDPSTRSQGIDSPPAPPRSAGGRPVSYDQTEYRGRNVIERGINLIKQWRALATRYDKHALTYRGGIILAAVLAWTH